MTVSTPAPKRFLKRWARRLFAWGSRLGPGGKRSTPALRILTYHRIVSDRCDPFAVDPDEFARQMEKVAAFCRVLRLDEALEGLEKGASQHPLAALTFDDGTSDFLHNGLPILSRLGLPATLYVSAGLVGTEGYLSWSELDEVLKAGVGVQSHGVTHRSLGRLPRSGVQGEVGESRKVLEDRLGQRVTSFAYPYGTVQDFNALAKEELRRAGYETACTSVNGLNERETDRLELRRTKIEQGDGPIFDAILAGGMDGWSFLDRNLWFFQNRYHGAG